MAFPLHPNAGDTYTNPLGTTWYYDPVENSWDLLTQAVGVTGSAGVTGVMGFTGAQGYTGAQGFTGTPGVTGIHGIDGNHGDTGQQGQTGIDGIIGLPGPQGLQGVTGSQGVTGLTGLTGAQGLTGLTGTIGNTGAQGLTGSQGYTGSAGVTGLRGLTGVQGVTGLIGFTGAGGLGISGLTQYHIPVANAAGSLVDSNLTQYNFGTVNDFTNPNNSRIVRVHPGAYCTGTGSSVGSIDTDVVPLELNIGHSDIYTEGDLKLNRAIALNSVSSDSGNPWDGGGSGSPVIINVAGKNVVRVAPSSDGTQYYAFNGQVNNQEILVVNETYSANPIPAIVLQTFANGLPKHRCEYGKCLKLYWDPNRGTSPGWLSVQDDHYLSGPVTVSLREGVSSIIISDTGYAARAGDITVLHLPYTAPSSYVWSSAQTYWILVSMLDGGSIPIFPKTSGKDCIGWFQKGSDGGMVLARFIVYNAGIYLRKAPDDDWSGTTGMVGFIPCCLTWTNE